VDAAAALTRYGRPQLMHEWLLTAPGARAGATSTA